MRHYAKSVESDLVVRGGIVPPVDRVGSGREAQEGQDAPSRDLSRYRSTSVERVRILHVVNRLTMGGTEYALIKLVRSLDEKLFDHRICALRGYEEKLLGGQQFDGCSLEACSPRGGRRFALFRLVNIMRKYRPHIVHSRNWGAFEAILAARLSKVPAVVHSEHGYEVEMLAGLPLRRRILRRSFYPLADVVLTVTRDLREYHARQAWISPERIQVIPNGVDLIKFSPCPEARSRMRKELGLGESSFVVGSVGRLVPIKSLGTLLTAVETLAERGIDARLLLVGTGPEEVDLQQRIRRSPTLPGRVLFLGASSRVAELLNAMDVFSLTSLCEGMSNTLLEAMATGLPVLATRVGGNLEVVEDGVSGQLLPPGEPQPLARALAQLFDRPELRRLYGTAARYQACRFFGLERMVQDYQNLYLHLAEEKRIWNRT